MQKQNEWLMYYQPEPLKKQVRDFEDTLSVFKVLKDFYFPEKEQNANTMPA